MKRGRRWWLIRLGIPLLVGLALFFWALHAGSQYSVILENQSGQPMPQVDVMRGGETHHIYKEIPRGGKVMATFKEAGPFRVEGRLGNGNVIGARFGDLGPRVDLVILPDGQITLRKSKD